MTKEKIRKIVQLALLPFTIMVIMTGCTNESSGPEWVAAELTNMNVIYVGVDNPLIVASSNHKVDLLQVSTDNGTILGADGRYMIRPVKPGKAKLSISAKGEFIGEKKLRVLSLPDPTAGVIVEIDGQAKFIKKGEISIVDLLEIDGIKAEIRGFLWDVDFKIVSFYFNVIGFKGISIIEKSDSNLFTDKQKDLMRRMRPGQVVKIEEINAIGPDGLIRTLNDITLEIAN